jgi:hypothetical protein
LRAPVDARKLAKELAVGSDHTAREVLAELGVKSRRNPSA